MLTDTEINKAIAEVKLSNGMTLKLDRASYDSLINDGWKAFYPRREGNVTYAQTYRWNSKLNKPEYAKVHRMLLGFPKGMVCHLNGDGLDCRMQNLKVGNHHENGTSYRTKRKSAASRFRGVHINNGRGKKWAAMFWSKGKCIYLGRFDSEIEAAKRCDKEAYKLFGEFAHLNFPDGKWKE